MTPQFETTVADVIRFNLYHRQHAPSQRRSRLIAKFALPVVATVIVLLDLIQYPGDDVLFIVILPWLLIAFLWIPVYPILEQWGIKRQVRLMYKGGQNKQIFGLHTISLTDDFVICSSEFGDLRTRWDAVERIERSTEFILIYNGSSSAYIIPCRAFESEESMTDFFNRVISLKQRYGASATSRS